MDAKEAPGLAATSDPEGNLLIDAIKNTPTGKGWKCPCCGHTLPFQSFDWLEELRALTDKYSHLGIGPDIAALTLIECWGLFQWLSKL